MEVSDALLQKYNVPVPRYTSYPPANHFTGAVTPDDYINQLENSNQGSPEHIALYIHIPFCRKICYYCGCNACSIGNGHLVAPYMDALKKEISVVAGHLDQNRMVSQIHYGGGTPNAIDPSWISGLNELINNRFRFISNPEIAMECHPAYLDREYIASLGRAGFNRISIGIQDLNPEITGRLNREPPVMPVSEMIGLLRNSGQDVRVNLDFIYGLPGQTVESFAETIAGAIALKPDRLVTFSYAHVPWLKKHQMILEKKGLPPPEIKMKMFLAAYDLLKSAGYRSIGLDHYVLPGDELDTALVNNELHRNFQGYCTRRTTGQVYAFGVSAISQLEKGYFQNTKDIPAYVDAIGKGRLAVEREYMLSGNQGIIRQVITTLMCNKRINWIEQAAMLNIEPADLRNIMRIDDGKLQEFERDGLIRLTEEEIRITEPGSLFIRNIAASIDPAFTEQFHRYSKSV